MKFVAENLYFFKFYYRVEPEIEIEILSYYLINLVLGIFLKNYNKKYLSFWKCYFYSLLVYFNMLCHVHAGFGDYLICTLTVIWPWVFNFSIKQINKIFIFIFRTSELVALMAISSTLFLFLHTRDLHTRLRSLQSVSNSASTSGTSEITVQIK